MLVHELGGPRWSFTVHGPEEFDKAPLIGLAEKVRRAAFVVAISSYGRSQLYRIVPPEHWPKVKVVPCGLESAYHAGAASPPPAARRLVCVGRLCEQKGQMLLVEAARVLAERGATFELVLAGDGEMRGAIEAQDRSLRARCPSSHHGLDQQRRGARGTLGRAGTGAAELCRGAACGDHGGDGAAAAGDQHVSWRAFRSLVQPGEHGWLVPAGDVEALAEAMQACLDAPWTCLRGWARLRMRGCWRGMMWIRRPGYWWRR